MSMTTYLHDTQYTSTSRKDINDTLREICAATGREWRVEEWTMKRRWRKPMTRYAVYLRLLPNFCEWQCINFAPETEGGWSINSYVTAQTVLAYFMGVMGGIAFAAIRGEKS